MHGVGHVGADEERARKRPPDLLRRVRAGGTYYWRASYPGDTNNNPITTACGASNEVLVMPDIKKRLIDLGITATPTSTASPCQTSTITAASNSCTSVSPRLA